LQSICVKQLLAQAAAAAAGGMLEQLLTAQAGFPGISVHQ
jgi:hypothetical protein